MRVLCIFAALLLIGTAFPITGVVSGITHPSSIKLVLYKGSKVASFIPFETGKFTMEASSGIYALEIHSVDHRFESLQVHVSESGEIIPYQLNMYSGKYSDPLSYPLNITSKGPIIFESPPATFNPLKLVLKNPMILLMGLVAILAYFLPGLIEQAALEQKAEEQRQLAKEAPNKKTQ